MTARRLPQRRDLAAALLALLVAAGGIYAVYVLPQENGEEDEDTADFRDTVRSDGKSIDAMIADTKAGRNLSDFRVGMFSMSLLNTLAERDPGLNAYFHTDGRTMQSYLTDVFQYHDAEEIAKVAAMAQAPESDTVKPMVRLSAKDALEALRHIPESKDPPETQAKARAALAEALSTLHTDLGKAAAE